MNKSQQMIATDKIASSGRWNRIEKAKPDRLTKQTSHSCVGSYTYDKGKAVLV